MDATKQARLAEFIKRLERAEPRSCAAEAYELLCTTLNAVESEMTTLAYNMDLPMDGRMYPPLADNAHVEGEVPGVVRYRSRGHNTRIDDGGAIRIDEVKGECLLNKPGKSGRLIELPPKA